MSLSFTQPMELSPFFAVSQRLPVLSGARMAEAMAKGIAGVSAPMFGGTIARRFLKCPELPVITAETVKRFAGMGGRYV
jgi:hypothetical protein